MNEQKIIELASRLVTAGVTQNSEEVAKISSELAAQLRQTDNEQRRVFTSLPLEDKVDFLKFTKQEILKMPKKFRQLFAVSDYTAHVRRRKSGATTWNYEIRYRRNGYNVCVSSNSLQDAKQKFIDRINEIEKNGGIYKSDTPSRFSEFATYFFENFYKRKVVDETYRIALSQLKNHLQPKFSNMPLRAITPKPCQELIDKLTDEGKGRTAEDIFTLLNLIFKAAIKHNMIISNPMDMVLVLYHERTHGKALTKEEEYILLSKTANTPYQLMFAVALYTGMRPNEYATARIEGAFIVANNSKRKNRKIELKRIPITPKLKPYLVGVTKFNFCRIETLRRVLNKILPNHKLYDLRTTFYTRCQECGIAEVAIKKFVGHTLGGLADTYTDVSDEFLLKEGAKFDY